MGRKVTGRNVTLGEMLQREKCYREKRYRENCYREKCLGEKRYTSDVTHRFSFLPDKKRERCPFSDNAIFPVGLYDICLLF